MSESILLSLQGVTKRFGGLVANNEITFDVYDGEILGLMGPNGAGKTVLMSMIAGAQAPTSGKIIFQGKDITGLPAHQISRLGLARTFQIPHPFTHLTVRENALVTGIFGRGVSREQALQENDEILDLVGLGDKKDTREGKLPLLALKKLEIARALARRPKLILLDEVFAGTTEAEVPQILDTINLFRKMGITIVIIEHVMKILCNVVDRIVVIDKGTWLAEGKPNDVVNNPDVIKAYFGS